MQGSKTPEDTELEFRKHYLVTGNVSGSARAVGIPISTGYELRTRALADERFVKAREDIRAKLLPDAEQMATAAMQLCLERLNIDPPDVAMLASLGAGKISVQDSGPQYAASLAKLYQAIVQGQRFDAEKEGQIRPSGEVVIKVSGPASAKSSADADAVD